MTDTANGYFEAFVTSRASTPTAADRKTMADATAACRELLPGSQIRWAGSQFKSTAIAGSDLDWCMETQSPVTESQRRDLRAHLERTLGRVVRVQSHVLRLPAAGVSPKIDIAFANAAFGSRPLPNADAFGAKPARQSAARALKLWLRAGGMPRVPGWVLEALVVHLDAGVSAATGLQLFQRTTDWLELKATPSVMEGVLRPAAFPKWNPQWSANLPGGLSALQNAVRAQKRRRPRPEEWRRPADVEPWLVG
jgi:hypothetical protein